MAARPAEARVAVRVEVDWEEARAVAEKEEEAREVEAVVRDLVGTAAATAAMAAREVGLVAEAAAVGRAARAMMEELEGALVVAMAEADWAAAAWAVALGGLENAAVEVAAAEKEVMAVGKATEWMVATVAAAPVVVVAVEAMEQATRAKEKPEVELEVP